MTKLEPTGFRPLNLVLQRAVDRACALRCAAAWLTLGPDGMRTQALAETILPLSFFKRNSAKTATAGATGGRLV